MDDACSAVWQTVGMLPWMVSTAQATELLEQTFVVGENVGRQRGSKRGALLSGGVNLSLQVGSLGAGGLGIGLHALLELGDDCLRAGLAVERLLMGDNDVLAGVLNLVQTLGQGGELVFQVLEPRGSRSRRRGASWQPRWRCWSESRWY